MSRGVNIIHAAQLSDNGYTVDMTDYDFCSALARLVVTTSAKSVWIKAWVVSDLYGLFPNQCEIGVWVNGAFYATCQASSNGANAWTVDLPAGNNTIEIVAGGQNKPAATVLGTFITATYFCGADYMINSIAPVDRLLIYGDSISCGFLAGNPTNEAWSMLLRALRGNVMIEGWGFRSLFSDCPDASARTTFVNLLESYTPSAIWIAIGTNDYGSSTWSAADFGMAYADLIDKLHAALPSILLYCQSPIHRATETANLMGNTLSDYQEQILTVTNTRSWSTFVDGFGASFPQVGDLADGIHPTTAGHVLYYLAARSVLGI